MKATLTIFAQLLLVSFTHLHAAETPAAVNLLPNPSFETHAGDAVDGWSSRAWTGNESARWAIENPGRSGGRCVSIASDHGSDAAWTASASVEAGACYRLAGWIKTKNVSGATGALLNIQNIQSVRTPAISGTQDWTRVETCFQAESTAKIEINCLFGGWGASTGQAWYDDVTLERIANLPEETWATVAIDTAAPSVPYSPMIFGGFLEHFHTQIYGGVFDPGSPLSNGKGFRKDVLAALKELKVPVVRWPGGCFVSGYHWEAGVGETRKPTEDMVWGVVEPNTFGTDEYVELCRELGWTPYICNNAGNGTIEEMRNWVEYCNGKSGKFAEMRGANGYAAPRNVPIWSVGNENYGTYEIGYKPIEQWAPLVRDAAKAMKQADPTVKLTAATVASREWTLPLLKEAGGYLDFLSIHAYWMPLFANNDMPDYLTCIMHSESPQTMISNYVGVIEEAGYRGKIKIAFDEWNLRSWHHPGFPRNKPAEYYDRLDRVTENVPRDLPRDNTNIQSVNQRLIADRAKNDIASQYTMADALFSASFFNACLRHAEDVGMANIAPLVNTRGPLFVHPKGIVKRTHFHAMAMYANGLQPRVGQLKLDAGRLRHGSGSIPVADAIATVDESGKQWTIALVNRHPKKSVAFTLKMKDVLLDGEYPAMVLSGDSPDAFNDIENPDRVAPRKTTLAFTKGEVSLPPHSLTLVKVPLKR
jgi:alpha-L-arabinofuranosidase